MTSPLVLLQAALADRYTIERELGRGGMATVYLAQDLKHHRPVALKVLNPQLAAVLGSERFLREIETAARLNHPHILSLFDSGAAGKRGNGEELLWYAMPLVEGESLRDRLNRETQLPLADALQIAREVADALGYAHARGIVHRDIKPENIMLAGYPSRDRGATGSCHAVVADFGIARAVGEAGGEKLTETGLSLGTPSYMSPEQALGETVDGRSDVYALGCVLYEMLAGEPPYTGPTPQAILARRLSMPVPSLGTIRDNLPPSVERAILTALGRAPADRFATASEFVAALNAPAVPATRKPLITRPSRRVAGVVLAGAAILAVVAAVRWLPTPSLPLDQNLVAVVPFRITGNDPSLAYLGEGMMDLLATKLNGDVGPRAVDPRFVLRVWNRRRENRADMSDDEVVELARELGAARVVLGGVVGTPGRLVLNASVLDVATGRTRQQTTVDGVQDSLPWLADRLVVELLALGAGVESQRLSSLTSASLSAVREYLHGRAAMRVGRWNSSIERFNQALLLDSTFALAALNLAAVSTWTDGSETRRGLRIASAAKDRLSFRDRSLLEARRKRSLRTWQEFVQKFPDIPEGWSAVGDAYYHEGALFGVPDAPVQALAAFRRAITLDPDTTAAPYAEPMMHLADLGLITGDTAGAIQLLTRLLADSVGEDDSRLQLSLAQLSGDAATVRRLHTEFNTMSWDNLFGIIFAGQQNETQIRNAQPAFEAVQGMSDAPSAVVRILGHDLALNRGRPSEAPRFDAADFHPRGHLRVRVSDALYWGGDSSLAAIAAESLGRLIVRRPPPVTDPDLHAYYYDVCMVEQWRLGNDDFRTIPTSIARLRAAAVVPKIAYPEEHERCADLLEAWHAVATNKPDALTLLLRLDSLQIQEPAVGVTASAITASNLIMARLWRMRGDWSRTEAAARRRYAGLMPTFLSTYLLEEGRAAAQAGHREAAIRALQHYLALRYDPEPSARHEVELVRAELAQLLGEPGR